jgi:hypothetical protein
VGAKLAACATTLQTHKAILNHPPPPLNPHACPSPSSTPKHSLAAPTTVHYHAHPYECAVGPPLPNNYQSVPSSPSDAPTSQTTAGMHPQMSKYAQLLHKSMHSLVLQLLSDAPQSPSWQAHRSPFHSTDTMHAHVQHMYPNCTPHTPLATLTYPVHHESNRQQGSGFPLHTWCLCIKHDLMLSTRPYTIGPPAAICCQQCSQKP